MVRFLAATAWLVVSGCTIVSQPPKPFANDSLRDSDRVAYLWHAGKVEQPAFSMQDFAVVTQIDDAVIPSAYRPAAGMEPVVAWRIEIPAGSHRIEILNKETAMCGPPGYLGSSCVVVEKSLHWVEFSAEPGRAYVPVVDEKCGSKWFWIVDTGPQPAAGDVKVSPLPFSDRVPAAGGEPPPGRPVSILRRCRCWARVKTHLGRAPCVQQTDGLLRAGNSRPWNPLSYAGPASRLDGGYRPGAVIDVHAKCDG